MASSLSTGSRMLMEFGTCIDAFAGRESARQSGLTERSLQIDGVKLNDFDATQYSASLPSAESAGSRSPRVAPQLAYADLANASFTSFS